MLGAALGPAQPRSSGGCHSGALQEAAIGLAPQGTLCIPSSTEDGLQGGGVGGCGEPLLSPDASTSTQGCLRFGNFIHA